MDFGMDLVDVGDAVETTKAIRAAWADNHLLGSGASSRRGRQLYLVPILA
jgi:hypothetical protein